MAPLSPARAHANPANNGRYGTPAGTHEWHTKWKAPSPPDAQPDFVLGNGFDAFINAEFAWLRYERSQLVDRTRRPSGDAEWDTARQLVYTTDHENHLTAVPTHPHAIPFAIPLVGGAQARRVCLHRHSDTFVAASLAEKVGGGAMATLETVTIAGASYQRRGLRIEPDAGSVRIALHNEFLVAAFPERLEFLDLDLQTKRTIPGPLACGGMSIDERGRVVLVSGFDVQFLTVAGTATVTSLPDSAPYLERPPLIGLDGTVYVLGPRRVVAIGEPGQIAWQYETPERIAGGAITGDDRLLLTTGSKLLRLTNKGQVATMQTFPGETMLTAPSFDGEGNLYLVTTKNVHCLWRG